MLTFVFLIAGILSFLTVAALAVYRLVVQRRSLPDLPRWEQTLALTNAVLAMAFFSLGIWRALEATSDDAPPPAAEATVQPPGEPTVILVPVPNDGEAPATPQPTPPPAGDDPPPPQPTVPAGPTPNEVLPVVSIELPPDGASVSATARVDGTSRGVGPGQARAGPAPWLYMLVRRDDGAEPSWWVQRYPVVQGDGRWNGFLSHGLAGLASGTPFDICAIVSEVSLATGQRDDEPRAVARDCVSVELA